MLVFIRYSDCFLCGREQERSTVCNTLLWLCLCRRIIHTVVSFFHNSVNDRLLWSPPFQSVKWQVVNMLRFNFSDTVSLKLCPFLGICQRLQECILTPLFLAHWELGRGPHIFEASILPVSCTPTTHY